MNKIYKVIWSKVKACYVVVSELAKRHSKCKSAKPAISLAALVTAFMLTAGHGVVYATDLAPTDNVGKIGAITIDSSKVDDSKFSRIVNIDGFIIDNSVQKYGTFNQYMQNIYGRYNQVGTNRSDTLLGLDGGAVHYYSVKSDQQAAGTNYANDGAKAADSMVIGISSSISEKAKNSTVLGNNNTLSNQPNARGVERDGENNSIVVGQNLTVEGARNAVFGTDYQNGTDKLLTHVAGERNTVIGVGNLVGYTAERVGTEWKYTKFKGHGDDENVVVGLTNTVNGGGVVVGTNTTVSAYGGVAFGHHNTVSGNEDKGVALGNDLNVSGYGALAVGTESAATGDYTIALGVESKAQANGCVNGI